MLVIVSTLKIIIIVTIIITIRVFFCEQIISYVYLLYTLSVGNNYKVKRHPQVCNWWFIHQATSYQVAVMPKI